MPKITKNTEMTAAQKETAFTVLGGYIKLNPTIKIVVDLFDKYNKQVIVKSKFNGLTFSLIIGARGKIISHNWA
jgi:hypothetical protein